MTDVRYGGFWIRIAANVLDLLMLGAVNQALVAAGFGVWVGESLINPRTGAVAGSYNATAAALVLLLPMVAIIGFWIVKGATPGKMICGLRIVDAGSGQHAKAWQYIGRYFMALAASSCVGIGYLWIAIDPRKQGWHDKLVRTVVIRRRG
jgi:uncharacterized RDD family membrane protein YckC